jgi:hypothetical protein
MGITAINGLAITASLADSASKVIVTDAPTGGTRYPPFVINTAGAERLEVDSGAYTYNNTSNTLTAGTFVGALTGTASWATSASRAVVANNSNTVDTLQTGAINALFYPLFVDANNGSPAAERPTTTGNYNFNPSTLEMRAGLINQAATPSLTSNNGTANLTIDASLTQSFYWAAAFSATQGLFVSNLSTGRHVKVYIRNTGSLPKGIGFSGSTTTTGHTGINMAVNAGAASVTTQPIVATSGTMVVWIENMGGFIVGGIM